MHRVQISDWYCDLCGRCCSHVPNLPHGWLKITVPAFQGITTNNKQNGTKTVIMCNACKDCIRD